MKNPWGWAKLTLKAIERFEKNKNRTEKTCTKCGETKPMELFASARERADGKNSRCKKCITERNRKKLENPELLKKSNEYSKRYYHFKKDRLF